MKKCPCCGSGKVNTNEAGDFGCKKCGYVCLSAETLFKKTQEDEILQNRNE